jgi:ABC-type phosphate transport system substrate-binding protein
MINIKKPVVLGVVASLALGIFAAVPAAHADPVSGSYVAVGSDTLDSSMNALANGTKLTGVSVRIKANGAAIGSFDAFGSSAIQTKPSGKYFQRPAGSGAGRNALIASIKGTTYGDTTKPGPVGVNISKQVDIARSSSGPGTNEALTTGLLEYVPYARDAVAYAYYGPTADLGNLTAAQLKDIYNKVPTTINGTTVIPLIPQSGSGTRNFFLDAIGVTTDGKGACLLDVCANSAVPENDASQLTQVGQIIPFSAANWVAQSNGIVTSTIPSSGNVLLGHPDGVAPFNGSGTSLTPNSAFYSNAAPLNLPWGRDTYLIVEYARVNPASPTYDADLAGLLDSTVATSLTNFSTDNPSQPGQIKAKFGFLPPSSTTVKRAYATI